MSTTRKSKATSHVTIGDNSFRCLHCGGEFKVPEVSINMFLAMGKGFTEDHKDCKPTEAAAKKMNAETVTAWIHSWDTGQSSKTIWYFFMGQHMPGDLRLGAIPYDPADFGRCYRLLELAPEWRAKLGTLGDGIAFWKPFTDAWAELEALYEEEIQRPDHLAPKLYKRMQALVKESDQIRYAP